MLAWPSRGSNDNEEQPPSRTNLCYPAIDAMRVLRTTMLMPIALSAVFMGPACDEPPTTQVPLLLSWSFVDGRSCSEAGVATVTVWAPDTPPVASECSAGLGQTAWIGRVSVGQFTVEGLTPDLTPLYRATAEMPDHAATLAVELRYVGGATR
jgi:hypothetical protein